MSYIIKNISLVKDASSIIFSAVAIVISILTYLKARRTILQPLRTEVIKTQTEMIMDLLENISGNNDVNYRVDYFNIVALNLMCHLKELGFVTSNDEKLKENIDKMSAGFMIVTEKEQLDWIEVEVGISSKIKGDGVEEMKVQSKKKFEDANSGEFEIEKLYYTKTYYNYISKLKSIKNSPFMPSKFQVILDKLLVDVSNNLTVVLKSVLEELIVEYCQRRKDEDVNITPTGVYNEFNRRRKSHSFYVNELVSESRKFLRIDEKW